MTPLASIWRRRRPARLAAIYLSPGAGQPMQPVEAVRAHAGTGLEGDRYAAHRGFWQATDACQVTLIGTDDLRRAGRGQTEAIRDKLDTGHHRRNLIVEGIKSRTLEGKTFRIGESVFAYLKPRPPCGYLDQIEGQGLCRALGRHSGICLRVLRSGLLRVGDTLEPLSESEADALKDR